MNIKNIENCCGCSACEQICGHGAIKMKLDGLGFLHPMIEPALCVDCGACSKVCPFENVLVQSNNGFPKAFAARHKELAEVECSRSGACFIALSDIVLQQHGVVYGAGFGNGFCVKHKRAQTTEQRNELRGSKYAQSDLRDIYKIVKEDLRDGRKVLFSGTPCQTAALLNFIPLRFQTGLYTIDIVCHGVASPKVWSDYLNYIVKKEKYKLTAVNFRDKQIFGWSGLHRESFTFNNGRTHTYPYTFYQPFLIRKSCHVCPYAKMPRPSDITLGDYWGWQRVDNAINADDKGVSLVLINSEKGQGLFDMASANLHVIPAKLGKYEQPNLQCSTEEHPFRKQFEEEYITYGFNYVWRKYWKTSKRERMKWILKRVLHQA